MYFLVIRTMNYEGRYSDRPEHLQTLCNFFIYDKKFFFHFLCILLHFGCGVYSQGEVRFKDVCSRFRSDDTSAGSWKRGDRLFVGVRGLEDCRRVRKY